MKKLKKGTLIRVHRPVSADVETVKQHGQLWVLRYNQGVARAYYTRSLATGYEHLWFRYEFEVNDGA